MRNGNLPASDKSASQLLYPTLLAVVTSTRILEALAGKSSEMRVPSKSVDEAQSNISFSSFGEQEDEHSLEPHRYPQCSTPPQTARLGAGATASNQQGHCLLPGKTLPQTKLNAMPSRKQFREIATSSNDFSRKEQQSTPETESSRTARTQTAPPSQIPRGPERPADSDDELASLLERTRIKDDEVTEQQVVGTRDAASSVRGLWCRGSHDVCVLLHS